jgi:hypothetical protein
MLRFSAKSVADVPPVAYLSAQQRRNDQADKTAQVDGIGTSISPERTHLPTQTYA